MRKKKKKRQFMFLCYKLLCNIEQTNKLPDIVQAT